MQTRTPLRVLVVDDDPVFHQHAVTWLVVRGHSVRSMGTAIGLVNRVASGAFDVVVLDCGLPGVAGPVALRLLAEDVRAAAVPVLLVSAGPGSFADAPLEAHGRARTHLKNGRGPTFAAEVEATAALAREGARSGVTP